MLTDDIPKLIAEDPQLEDVRKAAVDAWSKGEFQRYREYLGGGSMAKKLEARGLDPEFKQKQIGGTHYKECAIEPIEYVMANGLGYCEGSAIKYISRHRKKGGAQDILKAIHFLEMLLHFEYGENHGAS